MRDQLVVADAVGRTYRQGGRPVVAVQSASFRIYPGDRIAVAGPSGCGKSTLLTLIGGLETATSGRISWPAFGDATSLRPRHIAMVFQGPSLIPELTAIENVSLPLLLGDSKPLPPAAALAALRLFDLETLADRLPEEMSGGQMQRVALARAVAAGPRLILADEPTGQLDQATRDEVLDRLLAHLAGTETALVLTTHDRAVASRLRTVWRMQGGVLRSNPEHIEAVA